MICKQCGQQNPDTVSFCANCGSRLDAQNESQAAQAAPDAQPASAAVQQAAGPFTAKDLPDEFKPIGMWGYFGYQLLFALPVIGFILLLVFSLGGAKNVNLKNFARSYFCWLIIFCVLALIIVLLVAILGGTAALTGWIEDLI